MSDRNDFLFQPPIKRPARTGGPFDRLDRQRRQTRLVLDSPVGNGSDNDPQDVRNAKRALALAGFFPEDRARFPSSRADAMGDPHFETGIRAFQRAFGLAEDGVMKPRGESEATLNGVVDRARSTDASDTGSARSPESAEAPPQEKSRDPAARPPREEDPCQPIVDNIEFIARRLNALGDDSKETSAEIAAREDRFEELEALSPGDPFPGEPAEPRKTPQPPVFFPPFPGKSLRKQLEDNLRRSIPQLREQQQRNEGEWRKEQQKRVEKQREELDQLQTQLKGINAKRDNLNRNLKERAKQLDLCRRGLFVPPR